MSEDVNTSQSAAQGKSLVRYYLEEVWNKGNLGVLDQVVAPDYKRYISPTAPPLTPEGQKQRIAGLRAAFPDLNVTVEDLVAEGDRVSYRLTLRGTHQATFQGIAPTGKQVAFSAVDVVRIENGKFVEHWGGPDLLNVLQQLGAVISAG